MSYGTVLYLSRSDVERVGVSMVEIVDALASMFREKAAGRIEMPPKPGIHTRPDALMHAMPAYVPALDAAGMKWIAGYPANPAKGLPYITGLIVLNDPDTGLPIAIMDGTWITAMRTGAASALAGRYLARPDSSTVGIVACGVQGRSNLEAFLRPVRRRARPCVRRQRGQRHWIRGGDGRSARRGNPACSKAARRCPGHGHRGDQRPNPPRPRPAHPTPAGSSLEPLPALSTSTPTGRGIRSERPIE